MLLLPEMLSHLSMILHLHLCLSKLLASSWASLALRRLILFWALRALFAFGAAGFGVEPSASIGEEPAMELGSSSSIFIVAPIGGKEPEGMDVAIGGADMVAYWLRFGP